MDKFIKGAKTDEERDYFKFYKFCVLEISIALFDQTERLKQYFSLSDFGDLMVISHQLIGSISTEFKEVKRIFGLENLVKSAKGFYNYSNDNDIFGHVNKAFDDLWFSTTNLGRNVMADFEELNTIDTFSGFLLLLFRKKKVDIAKEWLLKLGDYLVEANKVGALTDHTSFANFSFLEFLLLFNFQDLFEKYKILFSGELNYLCNDNQENIIFEKPDDYQSVLNQYKDIWDKSYLANTNAEEIAIVIIKVAYSYRFNRDAGYGIEDIQKLLRKEIINQY